jgi:hypothetical protein
MSNDVEGTHLPQPPPGDTFVGRWPTMFVGARMQRHVGTYVL